MFITLPEGLETFDCHVRPGLAVQGFQDDLCTFIRVLFDEICDAEPDMQQFQQSFLILCGVVRGGDDAIQGWRRQVCTDDDRFVAFVRGARALRDAAKVEISRTGEEGRQTFVGIQVDEFKIFIRYQAHTSG